MDILQSVHPITINKTPSKRMVQFGDMFLANPMMKVLHDSMAKIVPIPENGFNIREFVGQDFDEVEVINKQFYTLITLAFPKTLLDKFNLSDEWLKLVVLALFFHAIIDLEVNPGFLDSEPIMFVAGKKNVASKLLDFEGKELIALLIPFHASKEQCHQWLDSHWDEIDTAMDHFMAKSVPFMDYLQNFALGKEIDGLRKQKKTYSEISKLLTDKYPDDSRLCDYGQIKIIHKRFKESDHQFDAGLNTLFSAVSNT